MKKLFQSFSYAKDGLLHMVNKERNFKIHLLAFASVCLVGFYFSIAAFEWLTILLISALVLGLEIVNTSIEKLCDLIEPNENPRIKIIKDTAAAAVFVAAAFAFVMALIIFVPYFFTQE